MPVRGSRRKRPGPTDYGVGRRAHHSERLACREGLLMQLRCMACEGFALTIDPPFPSPRSYDLLARRSQIALRFEDRSKRKKRRGVTASAPHIAAHSGVWRRVIRLCGSIRLRSRWRSRATLRRLRGAAQAGLPKPVGMLQPGFSHAGYGQPRLRGEQSRSRVCHL